MSKCTATLINDFPHTTYVFEPCPLNISFLSNIRNMIVCELFKRDWQTGVIYKKGPLLLLKKGINAGSNSTCVHKFEKH
jgi:hypothetical protein